VLNVGFVGALVASGEFEGVEARLQDVERCVQMTTNTGDEPEAAADVVVVDEEQFRSVPGAIELYRAAQALVRGDVLETVRHARRTLELAPEDDHLGRARAAGLMGLAFWSSGDLEEGHLAYSQCVRGLRRIGHVSVVMVCSIALADIRRTQGRLRGAMRTYEQALQQAAEQGGSLVRGAADMYVGISELHRERNDLPAALHDLQRSQELGQHAGLPQNRYRWCLAIARTAGSRRLGRRARPTRRGRAPVYQRLLP
jgi:LuxR family maltose regulon positive regulatory protein